MLFLTVRNDGTGNARIGSYDVTLQATQGRARFLEAQPPLFVQARVENFDRTEGWHALLRAVVEALEAQKEEVGA